jgi:hypothetical protein
VLLKGGEVKSIGVFDYSFTYNEGKTLTFTKSQISKPYLLDYKQFQGFLRKSENVFNVEVREIYDYYGQILTTGEILQVWRDKGKKSIRFYKNGREKGGSEYDKDWFCEIKAKSFWGEKKKQLIWQFNDKCDREGLKQLRILFGSKEDKKEFLEMAA